MPRLWVVSSVSVIISQSLSFTFVLCQLNCRENVFEYNNNVMHVKRERNYTSYFISFFG